MSAWIWFNIFLAIMLAIDLGVFNRKAHAVSTREAATWTAVWLTISILFNIGLYINMGVDAGLAWTTGYLIEYALSVDNIFVFILIISTLKVPAQYQHRLLFIGVISALAMRLSIILAGSYMLQHWHWLFYVFGAFLILTGFRMFKGEEEIGPRQVPLLNWVRNRMPVARDYHGAKFFSRVDGRLVATPMLVALVVIEFSDLMFAVDSIPAIFAITDDPFIVYTSNACAVLGLRSLYFLLASSLNQFHYLKHGLGIVLAFVGLKMLLKDFVEIPVLASLLAVMVILLGSVIYSLRHPLPTAPEMSEDREKTGVP